MGSKRLYRTEGSYKMLCGVCGGLAEYFDLDPTLAGSSPFLPSQWVSGPI